MIPKGQTVEQYTLPKSRVTIATIINPTAIHAVISRNFNKEGTNWIKVIPSTKFVGKVLAKSRKINAGATRNIIEMITLKIFQLFLLIKFYLL